MAKIDLSVSWDIASDSRGGWEISRMNAIFTTGDIIQKHWLYQFESELDERKEVINCLRFLRNRFLKKLRMALSKEASCYVSELMDRLGYSYDQIKYRQHMISESDKHHNKNSSCCTVVTTGGKGEGTAMPYESDTDTMYIVKGVICADNPQHFVGQNSTTLFQTERQETAPGYARLKLLTLRRGRSCSENNMRSSLFESETGSLYLSSAFFLAEKDMQMRRTSMRVEGNFEEKSGPSTPFTSGLQSFDTVTCFKVCCPDIIERWISRFRYHGWPSLDTIHEMSLLDGHVVPVGCKGSMDMYREWRICYSLAELHLMRELNETQLKLYILLKILSKTVLKPVCREMTSYIMKNLVLWICERTQKDMFTRELILDRLCKCIAFLLKCVSVNNLPSYMIPERNLLAGRLDIQQRKRLTRLLDDLLHEGGRMLLRCNKLRVAMIVMYKTPRIFKEFGEKRDKVESLVLMKTVIEDMTKRQGMSKEELHQLLSQNELLYDIETHISHLIQFDVQALRQMGKTNEEIIDLLNRTVAQLLS